MNVSCKKCCFGKKYWEYRPWRTILIIYNLAAPVFAFLVLNPRLEKNLRLHEIYDSESGNELRKHLKNIVCRAVGQNRKYWQLFLINAFVCDYAVKTIQKIKKQNYNNYARLPNYGCF